MKAYKFLKAIEYHNNGLVLTSINPQMSITQTQNKPKLSVVTSSFGGKCDIFVDALKNSITKLYPNIEILVIGKEIPSHDLKLIDNLCSNYELPGTSPGCLKTICWRQGLQAANSEWVLCIDVDTLLLKPIDEYINWCEKNNKDFLFTWRDSQIEWVNAGVMLIKLNKNTLSFFNNYVESVIEDTKLMKNDQHTFIQLLSRTEQQEQEIIECKDPQRIFSFSQDNVNFAGISCDIFNSAKHTKNINSNQFILHYKGILGTILLKDSKENRYQRFLDEGIFLYSFSELEQISHKISLWKKFANNDESKTILDVINHYNNNKHRNTVIRKLRRFFIKNMKKLIKFLFKIINFK